MRDITTIGIDLAKNVIQVHGVDKRGKPVCSANNPRPHSCAGLRKSVSHASRERCMLVAWKYYPASSTLFALTIGDPRGCRCVPAGFRTAHPSPAVCT
jgi:hypothetical protein